MMDVFDLILLGIGAYFILKVILKYIEIKKEMKQGDPEKEQGRGEF